VDLGRLGDSLLGGAMELDRALGERAVAEHVAAPLGFGTAEAAMAILQVANANMADAVRLISIRRGYDPREFALVVFGGAGPLHGVALARELSIPTVLVPPNPGITSALGCLLVDIRHDLSVMYLARADQVDPAAVEGEFERLEAEARERLGAEGVPEAQMQLQRFLDMRYLGQWRSMSIPVVPPLDLEGAAAIFHQEHEREHNYRRDEAVVEIFRLNVRAIGRTPKAELRRHDLNGTNPVPLGTRPIIFDELGEPVETPVFQRAALTAGTQLEGPAVIEQLDSTTLVPPGVRAEVDQWLNIRIHVGEQPQ
jgi:N-methylhydantoinase A